MNWQNVMPFQNGIFDFLPLKSYIRAKLSSRLTRDSRNFELNQEINVATNSPLVQNLKTLFSEFNEVEDIIYDLNRRGIELTEEQLQTHHNYSTFRNYHPTDTVLTPIDRRFNIDDYLENFQTTNLLSLDNHERYSKEMCIYMRCLFGSDATEAQLGPFQYIRILITMSMLSMIFIRNKAFQSCLNFLGKGSNGKSNFVEILREIFGSKMTYVPGDQFFAGGETQQLSANMEEICCTYDMDIEKVMKLSTFKMYITDEIMMPRRLLFRGLTRDKKNKSSFLACSNDPLHAPVGPNYDVAFDRRVLIMPLYNVLGKMQNKPDFKTHTGNYKLYQSNPANKNNRFSPYVHRPAKNNHETLFTQYKFDIKDEKVRKAIRRGILFYLLDTIHVFDLASLNASSNDYIESCVANRRLLAAANNIFFKALFEKYICADEFVSSYEEMEIYEEKSLDLAVFFIKNVPLSSRQNAALEVIVNILEQLLNIPITRYSEANILNPDENLGIFFFRSTLYLHFL